MDAFYYLKIGKSSDLKNRKERMLYRIFEIIPGAASWLTLFSLFFLSWFKPVWAAVFAICFVVYWLFRTIYFSFHLRTCYKKMKENEGIDWLGKLKKMGNRRDIFHLVVFPMHKEPLEIIRGSFKALLNSDWPKDKMIVILPYEEKAGRDAARTAQIIKEEFQNVFFKLLITCHPEGIEGEIPGKGSNESWGVVRAKQEIIDTNKIPYENIIVSAFDADTAVFPKYFSCLAYYYLTAEKPLRTSFQPIPLFINNIWQTPSVSRIFAFSASFWEMICSERPEKLITFSSHAMSFKTLSEVGFKQTNVVSEDSRIFWQCLLRYSGDYKVQPIYYPVSMDANVAPTFMKTMKNVYRQIRRWAYGAENVPYFLFGFLKDKKIPLAKKLSLGLTAFETYWSWATNSIIIFFLGWLPLVLGGKEFGQTLLSYNLPVFVRNILTIGMIGLVGSVFLSILLLPPKPINFGRRKYLILSLEWFLLPFIMIVFTSIPALEAQTRLMLGKYMGFWPTPKIR